MAKYLLSCSIISLALFIYIATYYFLTNNILMLKSNLTENTGYSVANRHWGNNYAICNSVWSNNKQSFSELNKNKGGNILRNISEILPKAGENCHTFLQTRGYWTKKVTQKERLFPIAFSILVYKDLDQIERLLRAIYRPNNVYCIHADRKSSDSFRNAVNEIARCLPNVFMCSKSEKISWGTFSIVQAELNCWKELLESKVQWKYLINLTGFEFPLKTNAELVKILEAMNGTNNIPGQKKGIRKDWAYYSWKDPYIPTNKRKPDPPHNITVSKGPTHLAASRGYVQYALNDQKAKDWFQWCRDVMFPDEHCFSTLNYNPHLKVPGGFTGSNLEKPKDWYVMRFKKWSQYNPEYKCRGEYVRFICHIGLGDIYYVTRSKYLFLNKIVLKKQPLAFQCLEYWIRDQANITLNIDVSHYSNISSKRSFD